MSSFTLTDAFVSLGGTDLSTSIRQITFALPVAPQDNSAMGVDTVSRLNGLKDLTCEIEFNQDFDAASVDATLWPLWATEFAMILRPTSAVVGVNNPEYTAQVLMPSYTPIQGSVGEVAVASISLQGAGPVARATT